MPATRVHVYHSDCVNFLRMRAASSSLTTAHQWRNHSPAAKHGNSETRTAAVAWIGKHSLSWVLLCFLFMVILVLLALDGIYFETCVVQKATSLSSLAKSRGNAVVSPAMTTNQWTTCRTRQTMSLCIYEDETPSQHGFDLPFASFIFSPHFKWITKHYSANGIHLVLVMALVARRTTHYFCVSHNALFSSFPVSRSLGLPMVR